MVAKTYTDTAAADDAVLSSDKRDLVQILNRSSKHLYKDYSPWDNDRGLLKSTQTRSCHEKNQGPVNSELRSAGCFNADLRAPD